MRNRILAALTAATCLLIIPEGCNNARQAIVGDDTLIAMDNLQALQLMNTKCFSCHNPDMQSRDRSAPPFFKVREHYLTDSKISKEQFAHRIVQFVRNPTEDNSIMPGAVRNFGLMPKMAFDTNDVRIIAEYLYDNDVSSDAWYAMWEKNKTSLPADSDTQSYAQKGRDLALATKTVLGKNLLAAIQKSGTENALTFCSTRAAIITDSMSTSLNAAIRRVSDKPRNPGNQASQTEIEIIEQYKSLIASKKEIVPVIRDSGSFVVGYYPIETNKMCLQCHGKNNTDITPQTAQRIKELYPADRATGYGENELRGVWVVKMQKE